MSEQDRLLTRAEKEAFLAQQPPPKPAFNDGIQKKRHGNGQLASEMTRIGGLLQGLCRRWHDNGVLAEESQYTDSKVHGLVRCWNREGKLVGEYTLNHGLGVMKRWNEDGTLDMEREMFPNGLLKATVMHDRNKPHVLYFILDRQITKKKFMELLAKQQTAG